MNKKKNISGFAGFPSSSTSRCVPFNDALLAQEQSFIIRGNGKSYGDIAFNEQLTVSFLDHKQVISFDIKTQKIECEAGILLSELTDFIREKGFKLFVIPGTEKITLGGAIANDVHGKNQQLFGSFGNHIESLKLQLANGEIVTCSNKENKPFFYNTIGGLGLTGIILSAVVKVRKLTANTLFVKNKKTDNILSLIHLFENSTCEMKAAWIKNPSQMLFTEADYIDENKQSKPKKPIKISYNFGGLFTSKISLKIVEWFLYKRAKEKAFEQNEKAFLHPLDAVEGWNNLYKNGFIQIQFALPKEHLEDAVKYCFMFCKKTGLVTFLSTLKAFGSIPSIGKMSFPKKGFAFSLDIKYTKGLEDQLKPLADYIIKLGGRFYLAKDSFLTDKQLKNSYPSYLEFKSFIKEKGAGKFASSFSKRVHLHQ